MKSGYVIKVSATDSVQELESALVSHPAVAEAAVIGLPHEIKGVAIHAFCLLKVGHEPDDALVETLRKHVSHEVGPISETGED